MYDASESTSAAVVDPNFRDRTRPFPSGSPAAAVHHITLHCTCTTSEPNQRFSRCPCGSCDPCKGVKRQPADPPAALGLVHSGTIPGPAAVVLWTSGPRPELAQDLQSMQWLIVVELFSGLALMCKHTCVCVGTSVSDRPRKFRLDRPFDFLRLRPSPLSAPCHSPAPRLLPPRRGGRHHLDLTSPPITSSPVDGPASGVGAGAASMAPEVIGDALSGERRS